jgi:hypothetical protein
MVFPVVDVDLDKIWRALRADAHTKEALVSCVRRDVRGEHEIKAQVESVARFNGIMADQTGVEPWLIQLDLAPAPENSEKPLDLDAIVVDTACFMLVCSGSNRGVLFYFVEFTSYTATSEHIYDQMEAQPKLAAYLLEGQPLLPSPLKVQLRDI